MNLPYSNPKHRTREELFFDLYARLLGWAGQLVRHDQAEAEDLVHDLYIQFVRANRSVDSIENVEAYLFTTIRNLYYSRMRRAGRDPINDFSIVDYDSVELGLAAVDRRQLLFVRSNLKQICRYACQRKGVARSAGILILRFFFGYYPSEVMKVTQSSRWAVDRSLLLARKEARQNLERPNAVQSIVQGKEISVSFGATSDDSENLFAQLRQAIFSSCEGDCFAEGVLEERYASTSQDGFTTPELAHLVSCKHCLDRANRILKLPLLSERSPEDALDHDTHSSSDGTNVQTGTAGTGNREAATTKKGRQRKRLEQRTRQLFEHRPASLQIAINGEIRASQNVTAEVSELYLKLSRSEQPGFIEVLSEQGLCLLYLHVEQPDYKSPLDQSQSITLSDDRSLLLSLSFAAEVPIVHVVYRDPIHSEQLAEDAQVVASSAIHVEAENLAQFPDATVAKTGSRNRPLRLILRTVHRVRHCWNSLVTPHMNPLFVSATVLAIASIICFSLWMWGPTRVTPTALLKRADASEIAAEAGPSHVIRQRISIRTPKQSLERSIYRDSSGRRRARQLPLDPRTEQLKAELAADGISWDAPLSAESYTDWHNRVQVKKDAVESSGGGLLKLVTTVANSNVVEESLTVRASDFHPVERTISLRDAGTVEIAELEYETLPWSAVGSSVFEPIGSMNSDLMRPSVHPSLRGMPFPLDEGELDEAELSAMLVLHQLHADSDGRIQIVRKTDGVQVKGIVQDEARKQALEKALATVPHVMTFLLTFQEFQGSQSPGAQITSIGTASEVSEPSPLEKYLLAKGVSRQSLSTFSRQLSESSTEIRQDSVAIAELSKRFAADQQLAGAARATLDQILAQRAANISAALNEELKAIAEIGLSPASVPLNSTADLDIAAAAERNRELCEELISSGAPQARSAAEILPELLQATSQVRSASRQMTAVTASYSSAGQKP